MNLNKYTEKAREAVAGAIELARQQNNPQLEPEHLLGLMLMNPLNPHQLQNRKLAHPRRKISLRKLRVKKVARQVEFEIHFHPAIWIPTFRNPVNIVKRRGQPLHPSQEPGSDVGRG